MSSAISYDSSSHTILVTLIGVLDEAAMDQAAAEVARLAHEHDCFRVLADLRQAISAVSTVAIFSIAQESKDLYGPRTPKSVRALVVNEYSEDAAFYETVSRNRGQNVRTFYDIEEAKRWLASTSVRDAN